MSAHLCHLVELAHLCRRSGCVLYAYLDYPKDRPLGHQRIACGGGRASETDSKTAQQALILREELALTVLAPAVVVWRTWEVLQKEQGDLDGR